MNDSTKKRTLIMVGLVVLSFVLYALVSSWEFAGILIGALLFHEYGHIWAMKRCGVPTSGIYLIPFVGGAAVASDRMPSREADVFISLMGPVFGLALAVATVFLYVWTGLVIFAAATAFMIGLNLFNLVPIYPLDGGRVLKCIAYSVPRREGIFLLGSSLVFAFFATMWVLGISIISIIVLLFAFEAFVDFVSGRPRREKMRAFLAESRRRIEQGTLSGRWSMRLSFLLHGGEDEKSLEDDSVPSSEEILPLILEAEERLQEPSPLTTRGILVSAGSWVLLIGAYGGLLWYAVSVPGILESLKNLGIGT